jgi:hypothetical protein
MTDVPDADDDIPDMIEEIWDGEGSWVGRVEVDRSPTLDGDVILTLPPHAFLGVHGDGRKDVAMPLDCPPRWAKASETGSLGDFD